MLIIDGSYLEGGGQIIRTSSSLSALKQIPVKIINIRKNRPNPGLQTQHLEGIRALSKLCNAKLINAELGSKQIEFYPEKIETKKINIKLSTAASIGLIFQILSIPAAFADNELKISIKGGSTASMWSPPLQYLENVALPILSKMGYKAEIEIKKHGFYPKGGAEVDFTIHPWKNIKPLSIEEQGKILEIGGVSLASTYLEKAKVAERQKNTARKILYDRFHIEPKIETKYVDSICPGSVIILWIKTENTVIGSDAIGQRGIRSEDLGKKSANDLIKDFESGSTIDRYMSDQCLPFMALSEGKSQVIAPELTNHAETNIWTIEKFLPAEFKVSKNGNVRVEKT